MYMAKVSSCWHVVSHCRVTVCGDTDWKMLAFRQVFNMRSLIWRCDLLYKLYITCTSNVQSADLWHIYYRITDQEVHRIYQKLIFLNDRHLSKCLIINSFHQTDLDIHCSTIFICLFYL